MKDNSSLEQLGSEISDAVFSILKKCYIEDYGKYRAAYSPNSKDSVYHAYLADNFQDLVCSAVSAGIKAYHNALSDELLKQGIDIGLFIPETPSDDTV